MNASGVTSYRLIEVFSFDILFADDFIFVLRIELYQCQEERECYRCSVWEVEKIYTKTASKKHDNHREVGILTNWESYLYGEYKKISAKSVDEVKSKFLEDIEKLISHYMPEL